MDRKAVAAFASSMLAFNRRSNNDDALCSTDHAQRHSRLQAVVINGDALHGLGHSLDVIDVSDKSSLSNPAETGN